MGRKGHTTDVLNQADQLLRENKPEIEIVKNLIPDKENITLKNVNSDITDVLSNIPPKVLEFFKYYLKGKSIVKAMRMADPSLDYASASVMGSRILSNYPELKRALIDQSGLSVRDIAQGISDLINHPNALIKAKGLQIAVKFEEVINREKQSGDNTNNFNVVIVKDKNSNVFSIDEN